MKRIVTLAAVLVAVTAAHAAAQTRPSVEVIAGVERVDYRYRFHNDSSFDTAFLVPHFFEQRYERTALVFGLRARYTLLSRRMTTALMLAPERRGFGSDFDTFFQPGGDVAKSGTAGDVDLGTFRVDHHVALGAKRGAIFEMFVGWRRDRADFHPADRVVTHTLPPSETRERTTDRERTVSQTFEVGLSGTIEVDMKTWQIEASARLVPALRARLLTQLPDKYPGRDIVFSAAGWSGSGRVEARRRFGRVDAGVWISIEQAGSYRRQAEFDRNAASAGAVIAFGSRR